MAIDNNTVLRVAKLAGLRLDPEAVDATARGLSSILTWIEQLNEVDVDGVEPMIIAVHHDLPMREDVVTDGGNAEAVLSNAPRRFGNFFGVPKVVE